MVSTRNRAGVNKQTEAGLVAPANTTPDLATILEGQAKMQPKLAGRLMKWSNLDRRTHA